MSLGVYVRDDIANILQALQMADDSSRAACNPQDDDAELYFLSRRLVRLEVAKAFGLNIDKERIEIAVTWKGLRGRLLRASGQ